MLGSPDVKTLAARSGGVVKAGVLSVNLLDGRVVVDPKKRSIVASVPEKDVLLDIVILHYLKGCLDNDALSKGEWLPFRQLPGGEAFQSAFQMRVVTMIAEKFSSRPNDMIDAGLKLKGRTETFGSATVILPFLPKLHVRVTVWQGDDEVPGNATVLFQPGASSLLPTEDLSEIGSAVRSALLRASSSVR
ncbi:MAG: DUF3786 domain-containing protein [Methanomassiliicoccales archaeon]